jgi:hypothetical protein
MPTFAEPVRSDPIHRVWFTKSRERPHECGHYEHILTGWPNVYLRGRNTARTVEIERGRRIVVHFDRRSLNPILQVAQLDHANPKIPRLANHRLAFTYA